ncbi:alpha/beta-hydrolase [Calocera viscosa TUFC12733]|uniref:Alpha/beta-hydrolase n=1 Tax=Calocera viscosa (strain TUFC12733) TaxID=1330018 RepID=A0A167JGK5_CALVF|nr:alpha/beta-hydrolase [Calocera viscosa TUFC12733]
MSLLLWLKKAFLYAHLKLHFGIFNLFLHVILFRRIREMRRLYHAQHLTISGTNGRGQLKIDLYSPPFAGAHHTPGPKPVHINLHGGGFCLDLHGTDARFCALVAKEVRCYVVDADYRMAPDHPFPAAFEDAQRVLDWVRANEAGMFDMGRITLGGFSAGGNLALALVGTAEEHVQGVVAFYPPTDCTIPYRLKPIPDGQPPIGRGRMVSHEEGDRILAAYLFGLPTPWTREMLADPRMSPRFAPPENFPDKGRTMIVSCEYDYLGEEGREMGRVLEEAGRGPEVLWMEGMGHGFDQLCAEGSEDARVRDEVWEKAVKVIGRAQA